MDMKNMTLSERAAYLKGILEGMNNEDKVISLMADILRDMALEIEDHQDQIDEICEAVDSIDEDLEQLAEDFYEDDGESDFEDDDEEDFDEDYPEDEELFDDDDLYELTCPTCGDTVCINGAMLAEGTIDCPNCGEKLEFDTDDLEEDEEDED